METHPEVLVCGTNYKIVGNNKSISIPSQHNDIKIELFRGNCICHPSVMIRKRIIDDQSIKYDNSKEPAEDYDLWVRLLSFGKSHNLQELLFENRVYNNQVSQKRAEEQKKNDIAAKFKLFNEFKYRLE